MGFISQDKGIKLSAVLTQKGREAMIKGGLEDFEIKYFSLGDQDVNYLVDVNLTSGLIPDLSGGANSAKSLAGGVSQRHTLYGGDKVGKLGTNLTIGGAISRVGFNSHKQTVKLTAGGTNLVKIPLSSVWPVVGGEQVKAYVLPISKGTSKGIYHSCKLKNNGIVAFNGKNEAYIELDLPQNVKSGDVVIEILPYKCPLKLTINRITVQVEGVN
jgi:hypothetical protein